MITTEHLNAIVAKCRQLLADAEKRTPGEWKVSDNDTQEKPLQPAFPGVCQVESNELIVDCFGLHGTSDEVKADARFISSCAGRAEAGWRATMATCEALLTLHGMEALAIQYREKAAIQKLTNDVLTAWPEELL